MVAISHWKKDILNKNYTQLTYSFYTVKPIASTSSRDAVVLPQTPSIPHYQGEQEQSLP
jgi:hypothetical protein